MKIIDWIKRNKLAAVLLAVLSFLFLRSLVAVLFGYRELDFVMPNDSGGSFPGYSTMGLSVPSVNSKAGVSSISREIGIMPPSVPVAPTTDVKSRMVIQESHLSLLVKDVARTLDTIKYEVSKAGGYMVDSNLDKPEVGGSGTITIRVPEAQLDQMLKTFKSLAVKVVSENLRGTDVTDQYVDNDSRLAILERNKARFEEIMGKAVNIDEIMRVQSQIFSLQSQIDSIKGQQNYLDKNAQLVKITIYLSTDELVLPYAPAQTWRPDVIFKQATRSLLGTLQGLGSLAIWLGVYAVIWLPILVAAIFILRRRGKKIVVK